MKNPGTDSQTDEEDPGPDGPTFVKRSAEKGQSSNKLNKLNKLNDSFLSSEKIWCFFLVNTNCH